MQICQLAEIEVLSDVWPRHELNLERVREFIALYEDGGLEALPPLLVATSDEGVDSRCSCVRAAIVACGARSLRLGRVRCGIRQGSVG